MELLYFWVTGSDAYNDGYGFHEHFFTILDHAYLNSFMTAVILAVVFAIIFYFGICMSVKTLRFANTGCWVVFLVLTGIVSYLVADIVFIGNGDESSLFYDYSFYAGIEKYYHMQLNDNLSADMLQDITQTKEAIIDRLNNHSDVAFPFCMTTALISLVMYVLFSYTISRSIPLKKRIPW